jgi:hypothetical protein
MLPMRASRIPNPNPPACPNGQLPANPLPQAPSPTAEAPQPERDLRGRFAAGNRGGSGNPFARRVADLRRALLDAVTPEDLQTLTRQLIAMAQAGDMAAARLVLAYTLGKPAAAVDPDKVENPAPPPAPAPAAAPWKRPVFKRPARGSPEEAVDRQTRKEFFEIIDNVLLPGLVRGLPPEALPPGIKLPPAAWAALGPSRSQVGGTGGQAPSPNGENGAATGAVPSPNGGNGAATRTAPSPNGGNGAAPENLDRG